MLQALAEFHKVLQIYGGTLYILNETEIESKAYDAEKASLLLSNVAYELKRLTCEVANELDEKNVKSKILSLEDMNIKMNKKVDFSTAHLEYATILKSYTRFLRNSRNILFGKGKKKKPKNSRNRKQWTEYSVLSKVYLWYRLAFNLYDSTVLVSECSRIVI